MKPLFSLSDSGSQAPVAAVVGDAVEERRIGFEGMRDERGKTVAAQRAGAGAESVGFGVAGRTYRWRLSMVAGGRGWEAVKPEERRLHCALSRLVGAKVLADCNTKVFEWKVRSTGATIFLFLISLAKVRCGC